VEILVEGNGICCGVAAVQVEAISQINLKGFAFKTAKG